MSLSDRETELLNLLSTDSAISVEELAKRLFVSMPTIRRDLMALADRGLILRTHGGATLRHDTAENRMPLYLRQSMNSREKRQIAESAATLVKNGDIVFLDASTTAAYLVPILADFKDVIVITSGVRTAMALSETGIKALCTGGLMINNSFSYIGQDAINMIRHYNADLFFFSCHGIADDGMLTDTSREENDLRAEMMHRAKRNVLLVDNSKFGLPCWHNLCHVSEVDHVFCNMPLPKAYGEPKYGCTVTDSANRV